jgi:excisionase family DNA binding protein
MSLTEWHRYVDRLSRPVPRDGEPAEAPGWRPWHESEADPEPTAPTLDAARVPDLAGMLGGGTRPQTAAPARDVFTDLTINDELPALREYPVPELQVPAFELKVARLAEISQETTTRSDPAPEPVRAAPTTEEAVFRRLKATDNWELLARLRGEAVPEPAEPAADSGARTRLRETRQELIQRLVDPTLTLEETAMILQVCPTTVRRYTNKGLLRHFRTKGNQRRFRFNDVVEFMEARAAEIEQDSQADRAAGRTD